MKFTVPNPSLEISFQDERAIGNESAVLEIKKNGEILCRVKAIIERKKDSDNVWHEVVVFRRVA